MINYPLKRSDVASTTWELKSKFLNHDKLEAVPEHMKINKLNNGPFDLTSVALQADVLNQSSNQKTKWVFKNSLDTLNLDTNDTNKGKEKTKVHSFITANNSSPADLNEDIIQEKNFIEDSDIWTLYNNEAQKSAYILGYRSWDKKNEIDCPIFLTDSTKYSDIIFKKNPSNAGIIEHKRLIKDIIYLLVGSPSLCFRWCQSKFVLRQPAIQLRYITPTAIQTIMNDMLIFGTIMKNLENTSHDIRSQPEKYGSISVSFACCLSDLLIHLQYTILSIFPISNVSNIQLKEIHHRMEVFFILLKQLNQLIYSSLRQGKQSTLVGHNLLSLLYNQIEIYDDLNIGYNNFYKSIYMSFFIHSSIPWLHILKKWLLYGECEDPYHEFFIKDSKLIDTLLPNFITLQQAEIIFNTGIAMKKLSSSNEDHSEKTNHLQWWDNFINTNNDSNTNIRNMKLTTEWLNKQAPILTLLSNPNIEQSSLFLNTFKIWMQWQNENHVPPLSIIVHQQILNPITNWCQWSLSNDTSLPVTVKNGYDMNRHDLVFTFWDNHDAEYPYQYYVDEKCPSVNITTHLNCSS